MVRREPMRTGGALRLENPRFDAIVGLGLRVKIFDQNGRLAGVDYLPVWTAWKGFQGMLASGCRPLNIGI